VKTRMLASVGLVAALLATLVVAGIATAGGSSKLSAQLRGASEKPAAPASNRGSVELTLKAGKVCWEFTVGKLDGKPTAAHVHKARAGVSGPVFVPLGTTFKREGCASASAAKLRALRTSPGGFYVNIHNAKHPAGAMRGQLRVHA
jgi:Tfp pilus tip-associated adhesin PilY1